MRAPAHRERQREGCLRYMVFLESFLQWFQHICCCFRFTLEVLNRRNDNTEDRSMDSSSTGDKEGGEYSALLNLQLKLIRAHPNRRPYGSAFCTSGALEKDFFSAYDEGFRYKIEEVIGKGSYGIVCSASDMQSGQKVAIKRIHNIFEHVSDATRILREIKLLRLLRHPNIVEVKHIILPPSPREFKDIYVVFELMDSDLHEVLKADNDLTPEHHRFFLYQLLRALKFIHSANVFHRDLKPKNILANADCKLKICDFGLARVALDNTASAVYWTDYVATRWYRAPELCGSFFSKYTPAVDIWSIGCIFAEVLTRKPLFPGKNVVHQLDLITNLLGTPPSEAISRVRNEKARRYLTAMKKKSGIPFSEKFSGVDSLAVELLKQLLAFDSRDRPSAEQALAHDYFKGLANVDKEPASLPISRLEFEFERRKLTADDVRELIYQEILEYHPQMLKDYLKTGKNSNFMFPSAVERFKRQFAQLEDNHGKQDLRALNRNHISLPRERGTVTTGDAANQGQETKSPHSLMLSASFSSAPRAP